MRLGAAPGILLWRWPSLLAAILAVPWRALIGPWFYLGSYIGVAAARLERTEANPTPNPTPTPTPDPNQVAAGTLGVDGGRCSGGRAAHD